MANLLRDGANWLNSQLKEHVSEPVDYVTPSGTLAGVLATPGQTTVEEESSNGVVVQAKVRDYIFDADDLVQGGEFIKPDETHRIKHGGLTCQPLPIDDRACFTYSDPSRRRIRVHTKVIKDETLPS